MMAERFAIHLRIWIHKDTETSDRAQNGGFCQATTFAIALLEETGLCLLVIANLSANGA